MFLCVFVAKHWCKEMSFTSTAFVRFLVIVQVSDLPCNWIWTQERLPQEFTDFTMLRM